MTFSVECRLPLQDSLYNAYKKSTPGLYSLRKSDPQSNFMTPVIISTPHELMVLRSIYTHIIAYSILYPIFTTHAFLTDFKLTGHICQEDVARLGPESSALTHGLNVST